MILGENIGSVFSDGVEVQRVFSHGKLVWERRGEDIDYTTIPFTIRAIDNEVSVEITQAFKYSINGGSWIQNTGETPIIINKKDRISIVARDVNSCYISGLSDVYGNIMSLLYGDDFIGQDSWVSYYTAGFFEDSDIRNARNLILPATTLTEGCYASMFKRCSSLKSAPKLPATIMVERCYYSMFLGCSSLISAPELPSITLAEYCYGLMFNQCSSLKSAPELPATKLAEYCYYGMFRECNGLTSAPELPAGVLVKGCYVKMFDDCSSLSYIKCYAYTNKYPDQNPVITPPPAASDCVRDWTYGVSPTGKFVCINNWFVNGYLLDYIPSTWTVEYFT